MAAGKPVLAYDCDGAGEVCLENETGFLVQPGDSKKLESHLLKLAGDPELRERLGSRGQALAMELFPVERMVEALHSLYESLAVTRLPRAGNLVHSSASSSPASSIRRP
jgi:glycosyltransferase involved in cell wall biosynthesis